MRIDACLKMEGLMKCKIVPRKDLYHPVLPYRWDKKIIFCLCRTCVQEHNANSEFQHLSDTERCVEGTWVIHEVRLAVAKGYKILEVLKIHEYRVTCYDPETGEGGFNTFFKLKAESSGFASRVRTEMDEVQYIDQFYQDEGVRLDRDSIRYNAAKRGLAKLYLNSMWDKLTERSNRTQTKFISEPAEL